VFLALTATFWVGSFADANADHVPGWTHLGDLGSWRVLPALTLAIVVALAAAGRISAARFVLVSVVGAGVLMYAARIVLQVVGADQDAGRLSDFPSGHTTATTALFGALAAVVWTATRSRAIRALTAGGAAAVIAAVAVARVAGGGHTVLDVVGGVALGVCWMAVCLLVLPPDSERTFARREILVGLLAAGISGFVFLAVLYPHEPLVSGDFDVSNWVAGNMPGWAESMGRAASDLGGVSAWLVAIAVALALVVMRRFRDAVWAGVTLAGIHVLVTVLKDGFDRPRPHAGSAVPLPGSPSFPSGHAAGAVVTFGVLAALAAERWPAHRYLFWALAAILAAAIGTSRVILDVHFVTDVVAGWCLGLAWLAGALLVRDALRARSTEDQRFTSRKQRAAMSTPANSG
jgi:undecaprenyl-diphosphatase